MIKYEQDKNTNLFVLGMYAAVEDFDTFVVSIESNPLDMTRTEMICLRSIIDQALNTSPEEIKIAKVRDNRKRFAPVDPNRVIPGICVDAYEADRIKKAARSMT